MIPGGVSLARSGRSNTPTGEKILRRTNSTQAQIAILEVGLGLAHGTCIVVKQAGILAGFL